MMEEKELKKLYTNVRKLTYYLLSLFYKTGCKYSCTPTKIGKILSILAFKYAVNGIELTESEIRKYDNCGTLLEEASWWVYLTEYLRDEDYDDKRYITDEFKNTIALPHRLQSRYNDIDRVNQETFCRLSLSVKEQIEEVFRLFGAYSMADLSEVLNPIAEKLTTVSDGVIDLRKLPLIIDEIDQDNKVIKYLKSEFVSNIINMDDGIVKSKVKVK